MTIDFRKIIVALKHVIFYILFYQNLKFVSYRSYLYYFFIIWTMQYIYVNFHGKIVLVAKLIDTFEIDLNIA